MNRSAYLRDQMATDCQHPQNDDQVCQYVSNFLQELDWQGDQRKYFLKPQYTNGYKFDGDYTYKSWKKNEKHLEYFFADGWDHTIKMQDDTHKLISDSYIKHRPYIKTWPYFFGTYYCDMKFDLRPPVKKINMITNRVTNDRLATLYDLFDKDYINKSNVSLLNTAKEDLSEHHPNCDAQTYFADKMPYCNFETTLEQSIIDAELSIVHETTITDLAICLTEKVFRLLQLPRPFVVYGSSNLIAWLEEMGFKTGSDFVDHSYDSIEDDNQRRQAVVESAYNFSWSDKLQDSFVKIADHNKALCLSLREQLPTQIPKILGVHSW